MVLVFKPALLVNINIFISMGYKNTSKYVNKFNIGQKYGEYVIIDGNIIIEREAKVTCKCSCGKISKVSCYSLIKGTSTKCLICGNSLKKENNPAWRGYNSLPGKVFSKIKRDAKFRNIEFDLTMVYLNDLFIKQNKKCLLSGLLLDNSHNNLTMSLDRINNDKGYIEGNVQWVHKDINMMKRIYTQEHFIKMCKLVTEHSGGAAGCEVK